MSVISGVVKDLLDVLTAQLKEDVREFARDIMEDLDAYANRVIKRALRSLVISIIWVSIILVGVVFVLVGVVTFLTPFLGPALSWSLVGLLLAGLGGFQLRFLLKPKSPVVRHTSRMGDGE